MSKKTDNTLISNRKAYYNYEILEDFEAGLLLLGTEIKSLRQRHGSLLEAYITIKKDEAFLIHASIPPYFFGNIHNHEEKRERKLLLHKHEIERLKKGIEQKGLTIVPLGIYLKKGKAKIKIALARGRKLHDKRQYIKEREQKRNIQKVMKEINE